MPWNMNESQNNYTERHQTEKEYILYDFIYMKF